MFTAGRLNVMQTKRPLKQVCGVSASSVQTLAKVCMKLDTYTEEQRPRTARCSADPGEDVQTASRWTAGGDATAHAHTLTGGTEPDGGLGHDRAGTTGQQGRQRAGVRTTGPALGTGESRAPSSPAHADRAPGWRANSQTSTRGRSPRWGRLRSDTRTALPVRGRWVNATSH